MAAVTSAAPNQRSGLVSEGPVDIGPIVRSPGRASPATICSMPPIDLEQSYANLKLERDAIALYDALSRIEKDPRRAGAFRKIAGNERRHAEIWAGKRAAITEGVPA